jgi:hypothetical protein
MLTRSYWFVRYGGYDVTKEAKWDEYGALYKPCAVHHRQFLLSITSGFGNGVEEIFDECDARQLLNAMVTSGPIEALTSADFYYTSDYGLPSRRMSILRRGDAYVLAFCGNEVGWFTPVVPSAEFLRFMRGVQRMLTISFANADGVMDMQHVTELSGSLASSSPADLGEFGTPEVIIYYREHYDETENRFFRLSATLHPKTGMCAMDVTESDRTPLDSRDKKEAFCDAKRLMEALNCENKVSALETLDWFAKGSEEVVQLRLVDRGETVALECDRCGVVTPVCVMSREELSRFLYVAYDMLKREM